MSKAKAKPIISPRGIFVYPHLNKPDTQFDEAGVYSVKLRLSAEDGASLVETIDAAMEKSFEKASEDNKGKKVKRADPPYTVDEETGDYLINFKMRATVTTQAGDTFTQRPSLKTPSLKDIPADKLIGGGSEGKIAFTMSPFYTALVGAGVSLRLRGVQVFKLVEPSFNCGFEAEDCDDEDSMIGDDSDDAAPFDGEADDDMSGEDSGDF